MSRNRRARRRTRFIGWRKKSRTCKPGTLGWDKAFITGFQGCIIVEILLMNS